MGYDAQCTCRYDGKKAEGKASLEGASLVFRGSFRVAVPLEEVSAAQVRNGWLALTFNGKTAELHLPGVAEKWADRILHPPSRLQKMGIETDMVVVPIDVTDGAFLDDLRKSGAVLSKTSRSADAIFFGAGHRVTLARLETLSRRLKPNGALWVIRPKGHPDITEAEVMAAGKRAGLVDVKVVSFSETHTAEKFVIPVARR